MNLAKWIVPNNTTNDVILNPSNPHRDSIKSTTKRIYSNLEIDFENQINFDAQLGLAVFGNYAGK